MGVLFALTSPFLVAGTQTATGATHSNVPAILGAKPHAHNRRSETYAWAAAVGPLGSIPQ